MRPLDGPDGAAAGLRLDQVQPVEPLTRHGENNHDENRPASSNGAGEPAAVLQTDPPPQADPPPLPAELELRLAALEAALVEVTRQLAGASDRALARERVIDRQHEEIERLKSVERAGQLRPVITDLCRLRNGLLRQAETVPAEMTGPQVATLLDSFAATVAEALERCGVIALPREVGGAFAPSRQQVATVVDIDDPEHDGTVAEVVQDGYAEIDSGKVVVAARVSLHRYLTKENTDD